MVKLTNEERLAQVKRIKENLHKLNDKEKQLFEEVLADLKSLGVKVDN